MRKFTENGCWMALVALAVVMVLSGNPVFAADKVEIKFTHVVAETTPKGQAALKLKELLDKTGLFDVKVYPSSQLYGDKEELEALLANNVQIIAPSVTKLVGFSPAFQLVDMPFLFANDDCMYKFQESEIGEKLMNSLASKGMLGLAWWPNGAKHFSNGKRPLKSPDDFKGIKFRTQSGGVLDAQFRALGAAPRPWPSPRSIRP